MFEFHFQNINFENTMTSHLSTVNSLRQNPSVEVRKIEYPPNGPVPYKSSRSLTPPRYDQKAHLSSGVRKILFILSYEGIFLKN